jgi:hypothetical protein
MEHSFFYIADGKLFLFDENGERELPSVMLDSYLRRVRESAERTAWKRSGEGAMFTQAYDPGADPSARVAAVRASILCARAHRSRILYALSIDDTCGIYIKASPDAREEGIAISSGTTAYREFDVLDDRMAVAAAFAGECHIGVLQSGSSQLRTLTEGRSFDSEPAWSHAHKDQIYFCSAGLAVSGDAPETNPMDHATMLQRMYAGAASTERGPSSICLLDIEKGTVEEIVADDHFDMVHPQSTADGALYYVRKPRQTAKQANGSCLMDLLLMPVRLLRALFGFFNLFSVKYGGKTLSSGDRRYRDETSLRIDGNFINAEKELQENRAKGEKNPGIIPRSWELRRRAADGTDTLVRRGVVAYRVEEDGSVLFSNGSGIFRLAPDGKEEKLSSVARVSFIGR